MFEGDASRRSQVSVSASGAQDLTSAPSRKLTRRCSMWAHETGEKKIVYKQESIPVGCVGVVKGDCVCPGGVHPQTQRHTPHPDPEPDTPPPPMNRMTDKCKR